MPFSILSKTPSIGFAQSAGAVEYTDCTSAEGKDPSLRVSWYDTKQSVG